MRDGEPGIQGGYVHVRVGNEGTKGLTKFLVRAFMSPPTITSILGWRMMRSRSSSRVSSYSAMDPVDLASGGRYTHTRSTGPREVAIVQAQIRRDLHGTTVTLLSISACHSMAAPPNGRLRRRATEGSIPDTAVKRAAPFVDRQSKSDSYSQCSCISTRWCSDSKRLT